MIKCDVKLKFLGQGDREYNCSVCGKSNDDFLTSIVDDCPGPNAEGKKDDSHKLRWSLLPMGTVEQIIEVLEHGAKKYSVDNWQRVDNQRTRYYNALMRHMELWWNGEKKDKESGKSHLAHAACCILFLMWDDSK